MVVCFRSSVYDCAARAISRGSLLLLVLATDVWASDLRFFADAAPRVPEAVGWVLEILVSHPAKPSRGFRRLPFQPDADADLEPVVDCQRLEPVPRARPHRKRAAALEGFEVCGVRLLQWSLGDVDRIALAATAQKAAGGTRWVQVLLDPSLNRRAWLQFAPSRSGEPLMSLRRLGDWIASSRQAVVPGHLKRQLTLRVEPSDGGEPAPRQIPKEGGDIAVDVLGVQGDWVRLAAEGEDCERTQAEGSGSCPAGWTRWRAGDGQPLILP